MGRVVLGLGSVQLLGARHRQHGSAASLRHARSRRSKWLKPLLAGEIRSAFLMTEPAVASSDATNIETSHRARRRRLRDQRPQMVVVGRRRSALQDRDRHGQDRSRDATATDSSRRSWCRWTRRASRSCACCRCSATTTRRTATAKCCSRMSACRLENMLLGEGRGFEIAQGRLGPGRIHHCMRTIGAAEGALEMMAKRLLSREAFGKKIAEHSVWEQRVAEARIDIEMMPAAVPQGRRHDGQGRQQGRAQLEIAMIKVAAPRMALRVIDDAIQAHGGMGVTTDAGPRQGLRAYPHACGWPTGRTKCTTAPSRVWKCANTPTRASKARHQPPSFARAIVRRW